MAASRRRTDRSPGLGVAAGPAGAEGGDREDQSAGDGAPTRVGVLIAPVGGEEDRTGGDDEDAPAYRRSRRRSGRGFLRGAREAAVEDDDGAATILGRDDPGVDQCSDEPGCRAAACVGECCAHTSMVLRTRVDGEYVLSYVCRSRVPSGGQREVGDRAENDGESSRTGGATRGMPSTAAGRVAPWATTAGIAIDSATPSPPGVRGIHVPMACAAGDEDRADADVGIERLERHPEWASASKTQLAVPGDEFRQQHRGAGDRAQVGEAVAVAQSAEHLDEPGPEARHATGHPFQP